MREFRAIADAAAVSLLVAGCSSGSSEDLAAWCAGADRLNSVEAAPIGMLATELSAMAEVAPSDIRQATEEAAQSASDSLESAQDRPQDDRVPAAMERPSDVTIVLKTGTPFSVYGELNTYWRTNC